MFLLKQAYHLSDSYLKRLQYCIHFPIHFQEWQNVLLSGHPELGGLTFQCSLFARTGDIVFAFVSVPDGIDLARIRKEEEEEEEEGEEKGVDKVQISSGISDAYLKGGFLHEYHPVDVSLGKEVSEAHTLNTLHLFD